MCSDSAIERAGWRARELRSLTDSQIEALVEFYDHPILARFYSQYLAEARAEQQRRAAAAADGPRAEPAIIL